MKLISVMGQTMCCKAPGRPPFISGNEEMRYPPRSVIVPSAVQYVGTGPKARIVISDPILVHDVRDADGEVVLERYGRAGIIALQPDEAPEDGLVRALTVRLDYLRLVLSMYREQQAARQASGLEILLPRPHHREFFKEQRIIQGHLANDEVLTADLGFGFTRPAGQTVEDPMANELRAMGMDPSAAPMLPRGISSLMDMEEAPAGGLL